AGHGRARGLRRARAALRARARHAQRPHRAAGVHRARPVARRRDPVSATATLVVSCPDRKGLVAALASLLHDHGANIREAQQHLDPSERIFSQRIHFDLADLDLPRSQLEELLRIECGRYQMRWRIAYSDRPKRVALLAARFEHCLYDLLIRHRLGELRCEIPLVISNHPDLESIATQFGVAYREFPIDKQTKAAQEARELELLDRERIDLVVLAR